jgi:hypothetical protein
MTTRQRAPVRRRAPSRTKAKPASLLQKAKTGGARQAAYRTYAAELLAHVRHRYEATPEPVPLLAADLGILPTSFYRLARDRAWVRRNDLPARDVPPAMQILEEAKALEVGGSVAVVDTADVAPDGAASYLAPLAGREPAPDLIRGRPPERSEGGRVRGSSRESELGEIPPHPNPLPCVRAFTPVFAGLCGERERAEFATPVPSPDAISTPPLLSTIERLERAVLAELATIEAMRAALGTLPQKPPGAARTVRALSMLTQTLQHLQRLRASAALAAKPIARNDHDDDDDMPADLDEFRLDLARRIDAFVESRSRLADAGNDPAPAAVEEAR